VSRGVHVFDVSCPSRDGVRLAGLVWVPEGDGPFPVAFHAFNAGLRNVSSSPLIHPMRLTDAGYACVLLDMRGTGKSEGEYTPIWSKYAVDDNYDAMDWITAQPWCNGSVAAFGASAAGFQALASVVSGHPSLRCAYIYGAPFGYDQNGGALDLGMHLPRAVRALAGDPTDYMWKTPLDKAFDETAAPHYFERLHHPAYDEVWREVDLVARADQIRVPIFHGVGTYDAFLMGHIRLQAALQEHQDPLVREASRFLLGPWEHHGYMNPLLSSSAGQRSFGSAAVSNSALQAPLLLGWLDRWLAGDESVDTGAPVRYFVSGPNQWERAAAWPPPTSAHTLFLDSAGQANTVAGDGRLSTQIPATSGSDAYRYDPANPVMTLGGRHLGEELVPPGVYDQAAIEAREDVLVYTSEPLTDPVAALGPAVVRLHAETSAVDTDFCVKIVDVEPAGYCANIGEGILRARYRKGLSHPDLVEPGSVNLYEIDCGHLTHTFQPGHRIRLDVTGSNFPQFDRNFNVAAEPATVAASDGLAATQRVHHGPVQPSALVMQVANSSA
jgi:predicted acyl esterase